jgi:histidinol-phosphatase (PHP family)
MAEQAVRLGFTHLGFSGHMDADTHMDIREYCRQIRLLRKQFEGKLDILMGVELDTLYDPDCAPEAEYIIGSTHFLDVDSGIPMSVDNSEEMLVQLCHEFFADDYYALSKAYYELEATVYDRLHCTFVGHFDLVTRFNDSLHFLDESDPRYYMPALEAMELLVKQGAAFELNTGAVSRGRKKDFYPAGFLLKNLHDFGGEIFINSDAHQKDLLDGCFDMAAGAAARCGFDHYNILEHDKSGKVVMRKIPLRQDQDGQLRLSPQG